MSSTSSIRTFEPPPRLRALLVLPQLGPRTEERDTFTRLLGLPLKGTVKGCAVIENDDALYVVRLAKGTRKVPYSEVAELIANAKQPLPPSPTDDDEVIFQLQCMAEDKLIEAAVRRGEVEVLDGNLHRMHSPFSSHRLEKAFVPIGALREYVRSIHGEVELVNAQATLGPAPVVDESTSVAPVAPRPAVTGPRFSVSRAALVNGHVHEWPTIDRDLKDASANGLSAAKAGARDWDESAALEWARSRGKLQPAGSPTSDLAQAAHSMASLPRRKHTLKG